MRELSAEDISGDWRAIGCPIERGVGGHTLLNAVLVGFAVIVNLLGDALNALVVVVLGRGAFLGLGALCGERRSAMCSRTNIRVMRPPIVPQLRRDGGAMAAAAAATADEDITHPPRAWA